LTLQIKLRIFAVHFNGPKEFDMTLEKTYSDQDVLAAISRASGMMLRSITTATDSHDRTFAAQGASPYTRGTGHVFAHVATYTQRLPSRDRDMIAIKGAQDNKSLWQSRNDAVSACKELLNGDVKVKQFLTKFSTPAQRAKYSSPVDVKNRPITGDYYGFAAGSNSLQKVTSAAINIYEVGGELIIFSAYPTAFAGFDDTIDLSWLFPGDA
jgi:hypothetical protein